MVLPVIHTTHSTEKTQSIGEELAVSLAAGSVPRILAFYGQLGSGKTTFIQGLAKGLGITSRLISPTFILERRYDIPETQKTFHHFDLYRLDETADMETLGLAEIFADPNAIVVLEWADRLTSLPTPRIDIFARYDDVEYTFTIVNKDEKGDTK